MWMMLKRHRLWAYNHVKCMYFLHETTFNHITVISKWWEMYLKLCFTISRFFENLNLETQDGHFNCVLLKSNNIKRLKFEKKK